MTRPVTRRTAVARAPILSLAAVADYGAAAPTTTRLAGLWLAGAGALGVQLRVSPSAAALVGQLRGTLGSAGSPVLSHIVVL